LLTSIYSRQEDQTLWNFLAFGPTGILTFLPLHAAGQVIAGGRDETSNYVVSSYIPTVNALLEARAAKPQPFNQVVGIAMVNTPHLPSLPKCGDRTYGDRPTFPSRLEVEI